MFCISSKAFKPVNTEGWRPPAFKLSYTHQDLIRAPNALALLPHCYPVGYFGPIWGFWSSNPPFTILCRIWNEIGDLYYKHCEYIVSFTIVYNWLAQQIRFRSLHLSAPSLCLHFLAKPTTAPANWPWAKNFQYLVTKASLSTLLFSTNWQPVKANKAVHFTGLITLPSVQS